MTDTTTSQTDTTDATAGKPQTDSGATEQKTFTQADVDRIVGERLAREKDKFGDYEDLKAKATRLQEIEDANKTEQQKANDKIAELTKQLEAKDAEVAKATLAALKADVAREKGVPANRLHGTTKDELEADADAYLAELAGRQAKTKTSRPAGALKSGAAGGDSTSAKERAAMALRAAARDR